MIKKTTNGFTKPSRGMSTKCESRTRVCRNRAFDSKCERFRLTKGTNELASCVTLSAELLRGAVASSGTKAAFTLAEVLITLAIVGVVAAITMPALIANIQERVKTARIQNITQKFGKATDKMKSLSTLGGYATTMDFVNELQKHLKIAKVCDNQHLTECWPTEKVMLDDDTEWEMKNTKTGKHLEMESNDTQEYGDTVGIITADGISIILSYDTKCDIDETPITWMDNKSSTSRCVAAVFDWNGSKMPNQLSKDVIVFNANGLGPNCLIKINGTCFTAPKPIIPLSNAECMERKSELGLKYCNSGDDYYAGAAAMCNGKDNLPTKDDLMALAEEIYPGKNISAVYTSFSQPYSNEYILNKMSDFGFLNNGTEAKPFFILFSNNEQSATYSYYRYYTPTDTKYTDCCRARNANDKQVICARK